MEVPVKFKSPFRRSRHIIGQAFKEIVGSMREPIASGRARDSLESFFLLSSLFWTSSN